MSYINKLIKYKLKSDILLAGSNTLIGGMQPYEHPHNRDDSPIIYVNSTTNATSNTIPLVDYWIRSDNGLSFKKYNSDEVITKLPPNVWFMYKLYRNISTGEIIHNQPPPEITWQITSDDTDSWYVNLTNSESKWKVPQNEWLVKFQYKNSSTGFDTIFRPNADIYKKVIQDGNIHYVNSKTGKSYSYPPDNSWIEERESDFRAKARVVLPIVNIPNFAQEDFEISNYQGAGVSDDIWPVLTLYYSRYGKKLSITGKKDKLNIFTIIPFNIGNQTEPILGKGTYTAVYMIKDVNSKINDGTGKYILRIYTRDQNNTSNNMFDYEKVKNEFVIFSRFMAKIYYYGSIYEPEKIIPLSKNGYPFDYNITKVYNTLSQEKIKLLTNIQKIKFLLQNIKMLDILASNNYIHCDYKIDNVAYENPDEMNVILIDYDITTLQQLVTTNRLIKFYPDNNVKTIYVSSTYPPVYISNYEPLQFPINVSFKLPLFYWNKYSIGGLVQIINSLNIEYNFNTILIPNELSNGKVTYLTPDRITDFLRLNDTNYDNIPTYTELYKIFTYLIDNNYIA